ncbi:MAG: MipA/OmpV family protein [Hyphomicrobiales bacterium]|nr:MipA/OmpV family protein [Hyphomicrobiales bacterium]
MRKLALSLNATIFAALMTGMAGAASAADPVLDSTYTDPVPAEEDTGLKSVTVGGIAIISPAYEGSEEYEVLPLPILFPDFGGEEPGFFSDFEVGGIDDVRYKLIKNGGFVAGPLAGYNFGRADDDGDLLEGLGDVDGGVVVGGFVGYRWHALMLDASYHHTISDEGGYLLRLGVETENAISNDLILSGRIGTTYADGDYMQNYFGVNAVQAASSVADVGPFDADAGFKDVNVELGLKANLTQNWSMLTTIGYSRLLGDAADSPIIETEDQFSGLFGLTYKIDLGD